MLGNLVESKPRETRRNAGTVASFVAHYGLILFALYTSAQAETLDDRSREEKIAFVETRPEPPLRKEPLSPEQVAAPLPVKDLQVLVPPVDIPTTIPEIDLSRGITDPNAFTGRRPLTVDSASAPTAARPHGGEAYGEREVEKPVMQTPNSAAPAYPDILRQAGVEGEALVSFVVDTAGRVEVGSFRVLRTSHDLFAAAVKNALPRMRFIPAEVGSNKVRQLVQQPYAFAIVK